MTERQTGDKERDGGGRNGEREGEKDCHKYLELMHWRLDWRWGLSTRSWLAVIRNSHLRISYIHILHDHVIE